MGTTSSAPKKQRTRRKQARPTIQVPFGPFPLCYATREFTPQLILGAAGWASLVQDAHARGICEHRVTRFFHAMCKPSDDALGTVSAKSLIRHIGGNARVHRLTETWVRRCAGEHSHMRFEDCVRSLLAAITTPLASRIQLVLDLRVKEAFIGRGAVQDMVIFLLRELTAGVKLDSWVDDRVRSVLPPMARILLEHMHSNGSLHDRDAFTHYCLRYSLLIPPVQLLIRHMRVAVFGPDTACGEAHSDAFLAAAAKAAQREAEDVSHLMTAEFDARIALACTARVLLLEAASTLAQPFLFGTHVTSIDVPDESTPQIRQRKTVSPVRRAISSRIQAASAALHAMREELASPSLGQSQRTALTRSAAADVLEATIPPMRMRVIADDGEGDGDNDTVQMEVQHPQPEMEGALVRAEAAPLRNTLEQQNLQLQHRQQHMMQEVASSVVNGMFTARASNRADMTSVAFRTHAGLLGFGGNIVEKRLQLRVATEASLPLLATVNAPVRSPAPTCSAFVRTHPAPKDADADLTSGVIAQRVLQHALTGLKPGSAFGVVHAACLLCGHDAAARDDSDSDQERDDAMSPSRQSPLLEERLEHTNDASSDGAATALPGSTADGLGDPDSLAMVPSSSTPRPTLPSRREGASIAQVAKLERAQELREKDARLATNVARARAMMAAVAGHTPLSSAAHPNADAGWDPGATSASAPLSHVDLEDSTVRVIMRRDRADLEAALLKELKRETDRQLNVASAVAKDIMTPVTLVSPQRRQSVVTPAAPLMTQRHEPSSKRSPQLSNKLQQQRSVRSLSARSAFPMEHSAILRYGGGTFRRRSEPDAAKPRRGRISYAAMPRDIEGNSGFCRRCLRYSWRALVDVIGFKDAAVVLRAAVLQAPSNVAVAAEVATARATHEPLFTARIAGDHKTIVRVADVPVEDTFLQFFDHASRAAFWYNVSTGVSTWVRPPDAATVIRKDNGDMM